MKPLFDDGQVSLYHARFEDLLPQLADRQFDVAIVDPPYGETSLAWDRWPDGWPALIAQVTRSLWCFGSLRMFLEHRDEFTAAGWKLSQDVIWEKHNGSGFHADRFKRVHEQAAFWYLGDWADIRHETPTTADATARAVRRKERPPHTGEIANSTYTSVDGGPRLTRSVIRVRSMHGRAIHPTLPPLRAGRSTPPRAGSSRPHGGCRMTACRTVRALSLSRAAAAHTNTPHAHNRTDQPNPTRRRP